MFNGGWILLLEVRLPVDILTDDLTSVLLAISLLTIGDCHWY
jgi:hypothetical protein